MTIPGSPDDPRLTLQPNRGFKGFFIGAVTGLIIGAIGGAYCMHVAARSTMPVAVDAVARGMAIDDLQRAGDARPSEAPPPEPVP